MATFPPRAILAARFACEDDTWRKLRIAMIGQKGLPATFGGIEHHVQEIGSRLAERGHDVTVFCRPNYAAEDQAEFLGMRLRHLPTVSTKHLDAIAHSAVATVAALRERYDVIHYHAEGPGMLAFAPRVASTPRVVVTIHGLDHDRAKWSRTAQVVLRAAGWLSAHVPDATITVSRDLTDHYARRYGCTTEYIPNGIPVGGPSPRGRLPATIEPGRYVLFVGRLVPEKQPDVLIKAFRMLRTDARLVIAGGDSFSGSYVDHLMRLAAGDERIVFTGYVFGDDLRCLYENAAAFVLPSSLEGLPLTLLEAIAAGTAVVVSEIAPHLEIVGADGPGHRVVPSGDVDALSRTLSTILADQPRERIGVAALRERIIRDYSWDSVTDATERLYLRLCAFRSRQAREPTDHLREAA
jgi:glycosyltransferase involved in cell wall biosynthesis